MPTFFNEADYPHVTPAWSYNGDGTLSGECDLIVEAIAEFPTARGYVLGLDNPDSRICIAAPFTTKHARLNPCHNGPARCDLCQVAIKAHALCLI